MANSPRLNFQRRFKASILKSPVTAINTTAARMDCGRLRNRSEKKSATNRVISAATKPDSGVRAPALSLTRDWDIPPLTGKPRPRPAIRFDAARARNSRFAAKRVPCFRANILPMAAVSTALSRKQAIARGSKSFRSLACRVGSPRVGRPSGTAPSNLTPRSPRFWTEASAMPATITTNATGLFFKKRLPSSNTSKAPAPSISDRG
jgi:hypothetical protein